MYVKTARVRWVVMCSCSITSHYKLWFVTTPIRWYLLVHEPIKGVLNPNFRPFSFELNKQDSKKW